MSPKNDFQLNHDAAECLFAPIIFTQQKKSVMYVRRTAHLLIITFTHASSFVNVSNNHTRINGVHSHAPVCQFQCNRTGHLVNSSLTHVISKDTRELNSRQWNVRHNNSKFENTSLVTPPTKKLLIYINACTTDLHFFRLDS